MRGSGRSQLSDNSMNVLLTFHSARAGNARNNMGQDYIGYDDQKSYQGHQQRAEKCLKLAGDNHRAVSRHNRYFGK
jgi:hypothetical protein